MKIPNDSQVFPTSAQLKMTVFDNEPIDAANSFFPEDVMAQEPEEDIVIVVQDDVEILEDVNYCIDFATSLDDLEEQILFEDMEIVDLIQSLEECESDDEACFSIDLESCAPYEDACFSIDPVSSFDDMDRIIDSDWC